jgi:hypothetical protein
MGHKPQIGYWMMSAWRSKKSCLRRWMSGLVDMSDFLILKRLILWSNVSAFSATQLKKVALRFKKSSRKSFWRGLRGRPRALINVLRSLPTCFAHVERLGKIVSLRGKTSRRKCATQSACAVEIHETIEPLRRGAPVTLRQARQRNNAQNRIAIGSARMQANTGA